MAESTERVITYYMKKYIMFPHGGSGNHGCEAIVRTTSNLLSPYQVTLYSEAVEEDMRYIGEPDLKIASSRKPIRRVSVGYCKALIRNRLLQDTDAFDALHFSPVISACDKNAVLLSIGGDNYCYGDNEYIYLVNRKARTRGVKTVLWGCSVEMDDVTPKMQADLMAYDQIVARESITYEALKKLNPNTVLYPDPAFTLPVGEGKFPEGLGKRPYIGINVSPMIQSKETQPGITMVNYRELIAGILQNTTDNIALIPHVVWWHNDDRKPLSELYEMFKDTERVFLVEDQNCMQLKDIISRCRIFIGARTHATIAAYSTGVPTLVVGYSVKARGIARDIFGTEEHYVLPVQSLRETDDLLKAYFRIAEKETEIREYLQTIMPDYITRARAAGKVLLGEVK